MASIGTVTLRMKVDTEALEAMRSMHLKMAREIEETIQRLSTFNDKPKVETDDAPSS